MKYIKYFILILLCVASFYLSDQVILYVENLSPIMQTIKEVEDNYNTEPIDAKIEGNTIIPGKKGTVVNERESYLKMNEFGVFNENFFVFDYIKPDISLSDFKDKIIIGSSKREYVSIIIDDWKYSDYLSDFDYSYLVKDSNNLKIISNVTYINGSIENYKSINNYLKSKKKLSNIVLAENANIHENKDKYIISPSLDLYHSNYYSSVSKIEGGMIIYVHDSVTLSEFKILMDTIKYKKLKLMELTEFITE
ncbi:MAG: hypothetical protein J5982_01855 [Bacilli bacterium]|nr:hypothetical protein [Bacilli bacterium]